MTEPSLSRFAGKSSKPRPTDTLIIPNLKLTSTVLAVLLNEREIFTVEPSPIQDGVWHVGVFESGKTVVLETLQAMGTARPASSTPSPGPARGKDR